MDVNEAMDVVAQAANDLAHGREEADPKQMRIALVVLMVELNKAAKALDVVIAGSN